jgi:ABC-type nickel/cobalt efflux system permease component RcnA
MGRRITLAVLALFAALSVPAAAVAHPLGNFTINTYVGIRVSAAELRLDVVVDFAEIPTFEERLDLDADADGSVGQPELDAARESRCDELAADVRLAVDRSPVPLEPAGSGLRLLQGAAAGAQTLRQVCEYVAPWPGGGLGPAGATVGLENVIRSERLGWREIVVEADGVTVTSTDEPLAASSVSSRLSAYPEDRLALPLDVSSVAFSVVPGGPALAPVSVDEVTWRPGFEPATVQAPAPAPSDAAVPGGVAGEIPEIFRTTDLSPGFALIAVGTALVLGAGHALTPGHGKTLMAAYLVGTRGTAVHAAGLGLSVTVSHTIGILALALLVTGAQSALPPDVVVRALPTLAALTIVAIGAWMLFAEMRRRRAALVAHEVAQRHEGAHADTQHEGEHSHGGVRHTHAAVPASTITWRSLFTLGLAGGLIPSTSALVILLGTIATGRTAFGIVLVVAFGLGMAVVLGGIGLLLVRARGWLDRMPRGSAPGRLAGALPLLAAVVVLGMGLWLTAHGVAGRPAL